MTQLDRIEKSLRAIETLLAALYAKSDYEIDAISELAQILREQPKPLADFDANGDLNVPEVL